MRQIAILIIVLFGLSSINAQWPTTPDSMYVPLVGPLPGGESPTIFLPIADDDNGLFYSHTGYGYGIQHMGENGELLWGPSGVDIPPIQRHLATLVDLEPGENGYLYVLYNDSEVWWDEVFIYRPYLYLCLFNEHGQLVWDEPFQVAADDAHGGMIEFLHGELIHDPSGDGIFVHWMEADSTSPLYKDKFQYIEDMGTYPEERYQQYGIRLDEPDRGISHIQRSEVKGIFINEDLSFDVFVTAGDTSLYFQKYNETADPLIPGPGITVSPEIFSFTSSTVIPQRYGEGYYVVRKGRKLQIIDSNGVDQLTQSDVDAIGDVGQFFLTMDDESTEIFTWTARLDSAINEYALVYQWYDSDLNKQYGPDGITIDTLDGFNWRHLYYLPGPQNSVYVCRTFPDDGRLYAQRFDRNGPMWAEWVLIHSVEWQNIYLQWTYAIVTTDGSLIVPLYSGQEFGFVRIRSDGSLGAPVSIKSYDSIPRRFVLGVPYPNPFNPSTSVQYDLPKTADVTIHIYDLLGRSIWSYQESIKPAGYYSLEWNGVNQNGKQVASGVYLISFSTPEFRAVQKAVLIR